MGSVRHRAGSRHLILGLICGVAAVFSFGGSAHADVKINPYPQGKVSLQELFPNTADTTEAAPEKGAPDVKVADVAPVRAPVKVPPVSLEPTKVPGVSQERAEGEVYVRRAVPVNVPGAEGTADEAVAGYAKQIAEIAPEASAAPVEEKIIVEKAGAVVKPISYAGPGADYTDPSISALAMRPRRYTSPVIDPYPVRDTAVSRAGAEEMPVQDVPVVAAIPVSADSSAATGSPASIRGPLGSIMRRPLGRTSAVDKVAPEWNALEGASMQETLGLWSQKAGVEFVWDGSYAVFDVRKTAMFDSSFEDAVRNLLDQYRESPVRPVGRLYVSPHNGKRVLVIEVVDGA